VDFSELVVTKESTVIDFTRLKDKHFLEFVSWSWFTGLDADTYDVAEVMKNGWTQTFPPGDVYSIPIVSGDIINNTDFGNFNDNSIHGIKFNDLNNNGIKDDAEPGLEDWEIVLTNSTGDIVGMTNTTNTGGYWFMGLIAGNYTVSEIQQSGWIQTAPASGNHTVEVVFNQDIFDQDFGNFDDSSIHGMKFNDLNNNGINDNEPGLEGWEITLTNSTGGTTIAFTNATGEYWFEGLIAGNYTVSETQQPGWEQTAPALGNYTIQIVTGQDVFERDFGNFDGNSIHGMKFNDLNNNGINDNEPGLPNWMIVLTNSTGGTTIEPTNSTGHYWFTGLSAGNYTVSEIQQPGWEQTAPALGNYTIEVETGQDVFERDFGNFKENKIHGMKFNDLNNNGINDNEPGLEDWEIVLKNSTGDIVGMTNTTNTGEYWFEGLIAGNYTVTEIQQSGWNQTAPALGNYTIPVVSGDIINNTDFGNFNDNEIHGVKFNDLNNNGIKDDAEPGLEDWEIVLKNSTGDIVGMTNTTNTGEYWFTGLIAGNYTVSEIQQPGWTQTFPLPSGVHNVTVVSGEKIEDLDFGNNEVQRP